MINRRIVANLIVFGILAAALIAYGFFDLLGDPLSQRTTISTVLPSAAGLSPNFNVTLDGVDVGAVKSVSLVPQGAKVAMTLNPGTHVPADVAARVAIANPLGEQEVQLVPRTSPTAGDPPHVPVQSIRSGAVIPAAPDSTPANVGAVVAEATRLLQAIPPGSLNDLLHETAVALNGNVDNLKTIASASELFSQEFLAQQQQFEALLTNAPPVLNNVTQNASALQQDLADTAILAEVFANHAGDLVHLFSSGSDAAAALESLVTQNEPNLACIVHDNSQIAANLATAPNLQNFSTVLSTNQLFFGAVKRLAVTGPAKALNSSDNARDDQEWLRTRLLIPGLQEPTSFPQPVQYAAPTKLPSVLPGAACDTEFGNGVGPVTQPGFRPAGPDASVVPPTNAEAQVRGGGTEPSGAAPAAADLQGGRSPVLPAALAGLVVLGWLVMLGHRRSTRTARPLRLSGRNVRGGSR